MKVLEDESPWLSSSSQSSASTDVRTKQMGRDHEAVQQREIVSEGRRRHGTRALKNAGSARTSCCP